MDSIFFNFCLTCVAAGIKKETVQRTNKARPITLLLKTGNITRSSRWKNRSESNIFISADKIYKVSCLVLSYLTLIDYFVRRNRTEIFKSSGNLFIPWFSSRSHLFICWLNLLMFQCFVTVSRQFWNCVSSHALGLSYTKMTSARRMPKFRGWNSKWLVITISSLFCLWCLDFSLAAPIRPLQDPSKPPKELIDSVSEKDVLVRQLFVVVS